MGDEYLVIPVFLSGIVFQALLVSRSMAAAAATASIAGGSLALAWYLTREEADQILSLPFMAVGLFILVFACFYRDQLLPRISAALLLHYSFLGVYALYVGAAGASVPGWILGIIAVPALVVLYLGVSPKPSGRFVKLTAYVWFLILLTLLIGQQLSLDGLKTLFDAEGFSLSLYAYIFVSGMVFLFFASNILYLLLLIPVSDRNRFWESVLGSNHDAAREHGDVLAAKMSSQKISMFQAMLLALHAGALVANYRWELVAPGLFMNVAVVAIALLSMTDGAPDADETGPLRMLASRTE